MKNNQSIVFCAASRASLLFISIRSILPLTPSVCKSMFFVARAYYRGLQQTVLFNHTLKFLVANSAKHQPNLIRFTSHLLIFDWQQENRVQVTQLFVDHNAQDTHHCSTSVVDLQVGLASLLGSTESVPSEINPVIAEITN